jgi:hypothetical protein
VISQVGYIPIPRIEYTDDSLDLVIENITLSGKNLLPNVIIHECQELLQVLALQRHRRPL